MLLSLAAILMLVAPAATPAPPPVRVAGGGPFPDHTVVVVLRDYVPSNEITIKHGESLRFVDGDPTAGPGHSFTETVPEGVNPKFDSDVIPFGTFKDVPNIESLPPGTYPFHCRIHDVVKGTLTVG
jgi:hypothetical protein